MFLFVRERGCSNFCSLLYIWYWNVFLSHTSVILHKYTHRNLYIDFTTYIKSYMYNLYLYIQKYITVLLSADLYIHTWRADNIWLQSPLVPQTCSTFESRVSPSFRYLLAMRDTTPTCQKDLWKPLGEIHFGGKTGYSTGWGWVRVWEGWRLEGKEILRCYEKSLSINEMRSLVCHCYILVHDMVFCLQIWVSGSQNIFI